MRLNVPLLCLALAAPLASAPAAQAALDTAKIEQVIGVKDSMIARWHAR